MVLFAAVCLFIFPSVAQTRELPHPQLSGCKQSHRSLVLKNPTVGENGTIIPDQRLVQAQFRPDGRTLIKVIEYPRSGEKLDSYNSRIVIERDHERKIFSVANLVTGRYFRVVESATLCMSDDRGAVFLAFAAGPTGATEAFIVIDLSEQGIAIQAFPTATQGRIIVKKSSPNEVQLWSASEAVGIDCDACKKRYSVQDCRVEKTNVKCQQQTGPPATVSPDIFMGKRIKLQ